MVEIADLSHLDPFAVRIAKALEQDKTVWVQGGPGSGRNSLARRVLHQFGKGTMLDLVPLMDPDAALHGLLQAAGMLPNPDDRAAAASETASLFDRAKRVGELFAAASAVLCVKVPGSWNLRDAAEEAREVDGRDVEVDDDSWHAFQVDRAKTLLRGFAAAAGLRVVMFTARDFARESVGWTPGEIYTLPSARANVAVLDSEEFWGRYAPHARELLAELDPADNAFSPFELRLAVGVVALGVPVKRVASALQSGGALNPLSRLLNISLAEPRNKELRKPVYRFAIARAPIGRDALLEIANPPAEHSPLLTTCIGYGDNEVRITESVRLTLLEDIGRVDRDVAEDANTRIAQYHEKLDGAVAPEQIVGTSGVSHWLEKVHHLANSGDRGRDKWEGLTLRCREFFLDRGRALSIQEKEYAGAARMYEKYVELAPDDSYGWHYLGWNLDKAKQRIDLADRAYATAIEKDQANPWWNSRYVTFLIRHARFDEALATWKGALRRVDPDGRRVRESPRLAMWLHRWVAAEWLDHGEVDEARSAFDTIPLKIVRSRFPLRMLAKRLEDAEESLELGDSVYPPDFKVARRWKAPQFLPQAREGKRLIAWYPGRVVSAGDEGVRLLIATPDKKRLVVNTLTPEQWTAAAAGWGASPSEARDFFIELGVYGAADGEMTVLPTAAPDREPSADERQ